MYKVIIADDESNIRNGLAQAIPWDELGMELAGMARDGEDALELITTVNPDICLLDIRMPFYDGLEIASKVKQTHPDTIIIFITGHDEFEFAQNALKLKVYDYILKPVNLVEIQNVLKKARREIEEKRERDKNYEFASMMLKKNLPAVRQGFIQEWINGELTEDEIREGISFYQIDESIKGLLVLKPNIDMVIRRNEEKERQLQLFAIQHIAENCLKECMPQIILRDRSDMILCLAAIPDYSVWSSKKLLIEEKIKSELGFGSVVYQTQTEKGVITTEFPNMYSELLEKMRSESVYLPIVKKLKEYADSNYKNPELRLQDYAEQMQVSLSHLSKLFKQETGVSYVDYITKVRLQHAIILMQDPALRVYEIADLTGYSSQHYFCVAFKKMFGISPSDYRKGSI